MHILGRKKIFAAGILLVGLFIATIASVLWVFGDTPLLSPITSATKLQFLSFQNSLRHSDKKKVVYGFLPYWNVKHVTLQPELTDVAYFSLTFDDTGHILSRQNGETEQGYHNLQSEAFLEIIQRAQQQHTNLEIVFTNFDPDEIPAFLYNNDSQERFLSELNSILLEYPFTGVNVDIEYVGDVTPELQNRLSGFMAKLRSNLQQRRSPVRLTIDVYASAGDNKHIWNLPEIVKSVDYVIVMAYDFHRRSSPLAGPVAPLFGGDQMWDSDITENLRVLMHSVPANKILLGVPFYGYEWQTLNRNSQAQTLPESGSTASYDRVQDILAQKEELQVQEGWNDSALSPFLSYIEKGKIFTIYYEDARSLSYKMDLVNELDLGGIAIWALGYEKDSRELWNVIK